VPVVDADAIIVNDDKVIVDDVSGSSEVARRQATIGQRPLRAGGQAGVGCPGSARVRRP